MNQQVIKNLELILSKLKTLDPNQFVYGNYVTESNGQCGTVCCVCGWFPTWFPNSGVKWDYDKEEGTVTIDTPEGHYRHEVIRHLLKLTGLDEEWVEYLFFGDYCPVDNLPNLDLESTYEQVKDAWEKTIEYFKNNPQIVSNYSLS